MCLKIGVIQFYTELHPKQISNVSVDVQFDPARMRPPEVPEVYGDCSKAAKELAWNPEIPLDQTLKDIYEEWYQIEKATKELLG